MVQGTWHGQIFRLNARVAELAYALALGASGISLGGSTPPSRTILLRLCMCIVGNGFVGINSWEAEIKI